MGRTRVRISWNVFEFHNCQRRTKRGHPSTHLHCPGTNPPHSATRSQRDILVASCRGLGGLEPTSKARLLQRHSHLKFHLSALAGLHRVTSQRLDPTKSYPNSFSTATPQSVPLPAALSLRAKVGPTGRLNGFLLSHKTTVGQLPGSLASLSCLSQTCRFGPSRTPRPFCLSMP